MCESLSFGKKWFWKIQYKDLPYSGCELDSFGSDKEHYLKVKAVKWLGCSHILKTRNGKGLSDLNDGGRNVQLEQGGGYITVSASSVFVFGSYCTEKKKRLD